MTFDGTHFHNNGKQLGIVAKQTRAGRWQYRDTTGKLVASGVDPRTFAKQFWFAELKEN